MLIDFITNYFRNYYDEDDIDELYEYETSSKESYESSDYSESSEYSEHVNKENKDDSINDVTDVNSNANSNANPVKEITENFIIMDIWRNIPKTINTKLAMMEFIIEYYVTKNYGLCHEELISIGNNIGIRLDIIDFEEMAKELAEELY